VLLGRTTPERTARMEDKTVTPIVAYLKSSRDTSSDPPTPKESPVNIPEVREERVFKGTGKGTRGKGELEKVGSAAREVVEDTSMESRRVVASVKLSFLGGGGGEVVEVVEGVRPIAISGGRGGGLVLSARRWSACKEVECMRSRGDAPASSDSFLSFAAAAISSSTSSFLHLCGILRCFCGVLVCLRVLLVVLMGD
jgi:hypothetical protein